MCLQASNTATAVEDDDYVVGDDDSPDVLMEDGGDIMDDQLPSRGEGAAARQQTAVAAAVRRPVSNADAGADVALQLLGICETLGGSATAGDYKQILQVYITWTSSFGWHLLHLFEWVQQTKYCASKQNDLHGHAVFVTAPCCSPPALFGQQASHGSPACRKSVQTAQPKLWVLACFRSVKQRAMPLLLAT